MKITFLGAAGAVTGSCFVMEHEGKRFAIDCGMHQGNEEIEKRNSSVENYDPSGIEYFIITHAHIDHSGLLPAMVKNGFKGPIYCTPPTRDLLEIMLMDSAHIQEMETEWRNRKRLRHGKSSLEPIYNQADAQAAIELLTPVDYEQQINTTNGLEARFLDAGHILGSAMVEILYKQNGGMAKLVFSGDLGRPNQLIVNEPSRIETADYLFMESTYGDRNHQNEEDSRDELAAAIKYAYDNGQKVIIPAFAVERTQEIIFCLHQLENEGRLPDDMPVFLDSPLAIKATEIFKKYTRYMDGDIQASLANGEDPLGLKNLRYTQKTVESQAINNSTGPAIIISASGMANAGRIKHHLRHNLWRPGAAVVFVGFQAVGTPGRKIVDGVKKIRILGEEVAVKAKIFTIGGFSAHAGQSQILDWLGNFKNPNMRVVLVHGESKAQRTLAKLIQDKYNYKVHVPEYLEELTLEPGLVMTPVVDMERAKPAINWEYLVGVAGGSFNEFSARMEDIRNRPWEEQTEIRDRLMAINNSLVELVSEL